MTTAAAAVHRRLVHDRRVERLVSRIATLIPPRAAVVDVGSGDGLLAARLLAARPDIRVRAFDVLGRAGTHVPVEPFDGEHLPIDEASCDVALLVDVLHHTDDPRPLLAECVRVTRRAVVIKDHLREGVAAGPTLRFMDWVGNARHGVHLPYNYLARSEWRELIASVGLRREEWSERIGLYPVPADWLFGRHLHFLARLVRSDQPA